MKIWVNIVLFFFITFLSTPTVIGMIDDKVNTSFFYSMCEEEENHAPFNEIKSVAATQFSFDNLTPIKLKKFNFVLVHDLTFDNLAHQIFSPPPETV
ncbi:hypothetical protein [Flavobacterium channae]|uniref:hypothetical protein n=1 Tax=Flavobacterium channae TaxID=2897181 RepID=UPI001E3D6C07|nr:hypothetical protein [Flavobacterium channae]UGS24628.1 hypothetical protein LOS89_04965 [Flavobacterium channae]